MAGDVDRKRGSLLNIAKPLGSTAPARNHSARLRGGVVAEDFQHGLMDEPCLATAMRQEQKPVAEKPSQTHTVYMSREAEQETKYSGRL